MAKVQLSRHPGTAIQCIISVRYARNSIELHGDRYVKDDHAIVGCSFDDSQPVVAHRTPVERNFYEANHI